MVTRDDYKNLLNWGKGQTFTLNEACDYMQELDKYGTNHTINWVNAKTKEPVSIGYTGAKQHNSIK